MLTRPGQPVKTLHKYLHQNTEDRCLGVDGCKIGWFFVALGQGDNAEFGVFEKIGLLFCAYFNAKSILIDIPIGLPFERIKNRCCDKEARKVLGPKRAGAVFAPPCRIALSTHDYAEASRINREVLGKGISRQTYNIMSKIKEVDDFLNQHPEAKKTMRETHPEICFWALAGQRPMQHKKKSPEGRDERLALLEHHYARSRSIYVAAVDRYLRKDVRRDDILDALVNAVTALRLKKHEKTLPSISQIDQKDLPMEMVYSAVD
jgi:predicted RNase H-like nuclease